MKIWWCVTHNDRAILDQVYGEMGCRFAGILGGDCHQIEMELVPVEVSTPVILFGEVEEPGSKELGRTK